MASKHEEPQHNCESCLYRIATAHNRNVCAQKDMYLDYNNVILDTCPLWCKK